MKHRDDEGASVDLVRGQLAQAARYFRQKEKRVNSNPLGPMIGTHATKIFCLTSSNDGRIALCGALSDLATTSA